jgi:hypothetical protein
VHRNGTWAGVLPSASWDPLALGRFVLFRASDPLNLLSNVSSFAISRSDLPRLAVSSRDQDGSKAPPPLVSFVYGSENETHWHAIPIGTDHDPLQSADIAYGGGRYVIAGMRNGGTVILDSTDGETWHEQALGGVAGGLAAPTLEYVHEPLPLDIDDSWADGLDCTNARCVVIRSGLYLVP